MDPAAEHLQRGLNQAEGGGGWSARAGSDAAEACHVDDDEK